MLEALRPPLQHPEHPRRDCVAEDGQGCGYLMTDTPTPVSPKQLRDLYIDVKVKKPE
jgi:hypothetical protein